MFTFSLETGSIKSAGICLKRTWFSVQNNTSSAVVCKPWQFQEVLTRSFWLISSFNLVIANFVYLMINCDRNAFQFHSSYFYHFCLIMYLLSTIDIDVIFFYPILHPGKASGQMWHIEQFAQFGGSFGFTEGSHIFTAKPSCRSHLSPP